MTCRSPSIKSCEAQLFLSLSLSWVSVMLISAPWRSLMVMRKPSTRRPSVNTWLQISCSLCHSMTSRITRIYSPKRSSKKCRVNSSTSCARTISSLIQELKSNEDRSRLSSQCVQQRTRSGRSPSTSWTSVKCSCSRPRKWALISTESRTSWSQKVYAKPSSTFSSITCRTRAT